jgi:hypothetical protein
LILQDKCSWDTLHCQREVFDLTLQQNQSQLNMKILLINVAFALFFSPLFAQEVIQKGGDRVNSFTKTEQSIKAEILLENGKDEKVPVKLTISLADMTNEDISIATSWKTLITVNIKAKFSCTNRTTYVPNNVFMAKSDDGSVFGQIKGSAKNAYGGEGDISLMFSIDNGELKF